MLPLLDYYCLEEAGVGFVEKRCCYDKKLLLDVEDLGYWLIEEEDFAHCYPLF